MAECGCRRPHGLKPPTLIMCDTHAAALEVELEQEPRLLWALLRVAQRAAEKETD